MAPRPALGLGSAGKLDDGQLSVGGLIFGAKKNTPGDPNRRKSVTTLWSDFRDHGAIFATPHTVFHSGEDQKTVAIFEQVLKREPKNRRRALGDFSSAGVRKWSRRLPRNAPRKAPRKLLRKPLWELKGSKTHIKAYLPGDQPEAPNAS